MISPLLANLLMHYAFDTWMRRSHPGIDFERYVDDGIVHAGSLAEAERLLESIRERLRECRLELHPVKTKIVHCRDDRRPDRYEQEQFDFLGYTFRARLSKTKWGKLFVGFSPAISRAAALKIHDEVRSWHLTRQWSTVSAEALGKWLSPKVRGWLQYYGKFSPWALRPLLSHLRRCIRRWAQRKQKSLRHSGNRAARWVNRLALKEPRFAWLQGVH